jgi:hypothetical protein
MFETDLQPEEWALLFLIQEGLYPPDRDLNPFILRLMKLGLVEIDERQTLRITDLAQAAFARRDRGLH